MRRENIVAFLDTMIFLHFQPFDQIDWPTVLNANHVTLIIPPIIMRELNNHKDTHALRKIRERAQRVIGRLLELFKDGDQANVKRNVEVKYQTAEPNIDFETYKLDPKSGDDLLLATILSFKAELPDINVVIVTEDLHLILKSRQYDISALQLTEELKLPDVLDDYEKEIKKLERTIHELTSRSPLLRLGFANRSDHAKFTLIKPSVTTVEEIEQTMKHLKQQYPTMAIPPPATVDTSKRKSGVTMSELAQLFETIGGYTVEERHSYNAALDQFFSDYRSYLKETVTYLEVQARTVALNVLAYNDGTAPGEDIDIQLHFPDGFTLASSDARRPAKPNAPKAQTTMEKLQESLRSPYLNSAAFLPRGHVVERSTERPNVSTPTIRKTKSYDVASRIERLKHNQPIYLYQLYCVFDSFESAKSFEIEYQIKAGNVPNLVSGTLRVIIEKKSVA